MHRNVHSNRQSRPDLDVGRDTWVSDFQPKESHARIFVSLCQEIRIFVGDEDLSRPKARWRQIVSFLAGTSMVFMIIEAFETERKRS